MQARLLGFLKGSVTLEVENCVSHEKILNELVKIMPVYGVKLKNDGKIILTVDFANLDNIFAFFSEKCYNIKVIKTNGIAPLFASLRKRWGLIVGCVIFLAASLCFSLMTWKVNVTSLNDYDTAKVAEKLDEEKVIPSFVRQADCKKIANFIYLNFEDIAYVECSKKGVSVNIRLVPTIPSQAASENDRDTVVCENEGIVSRIIVKSGTPLVKVGDIVSKGQVLIIGEMEGQKTPAIGDVFVRKTLSVSSKFQMTSEEFESKKAGLILKTRQDLCMEISGSFEITAEITETNTTDNISYINMIIQVEQKAQGDF